MSKVKFTTKQKEPKKGMSFVSMVMDPVFVEVKKVNFPTDQGDKEVEEISFYPNSTITQENIKKKLEIQGMKVPKLTFEIEIEGSKIKFEEVGGGGRFTSVPAGSAGIKKEPSDNVLKGKRLELRDYSLDNIKKSDEEEPDIDTSGLTFTCPQCNKEAPTSDAIEHERTKYCSPKCRDDAQEKPPQEECPQCHKKFANLPISGSQGKSYCSDECKQAAEKKEPEKDAPEPEKYNPQKDIDKAEQQRKAEETKNRTELDSLIQKGKGQDSPEDLKTTLAQIEQKKSTQAYQELKSEIDGLKNKLNGKLTLSEVQQRETAKLDALLTENNLKKEDLDTEIQTKLTNISNDSDLSSLTAHSEEVSKAINQKGANKKFELILVQIKDIKPDNNSKKQELKTQLETLLKSDDHFIQEYVKTHRSEIENALSQLAVQNKKDTPNNDNKAGLSTKQKIGLGVGIGGGVAVIIGLVIFLRRKKSSRRSL